MYMQVCVRKGGGGGGGFPDVICVPRERESHLTPKPPIHEARQSHPARRHHEFNTCSSPQSRPSRPPHPPHHHLDSRARARPIRPAPTRRTTVWILEPTHALFAHYMTTASPLSAAFDYSPIIADSLRLCTRPICPQCGHYLAIFDKSNIMWLLAATDTLFSQTFCVYLTIGWL